MRFNLSEWSLNNRPLILFLMIMLGLAGFFSYSQLGQSEDPPFTFKAMVIQTLWPGATAEEVSQQVTERIEKKLMETGEFERIVSFSRPGESQVTFLASDDFKSKDIPELWYQLRKKIGDIQYSLPQGTIGPFFNDEFGTTFGNIYTLTGDGFDYATLKDYADRLQLQLQRVKNVGKVEILGLQEERIWVEISNTRLATMGVPWQTVQQALEEQNTVTATGFFETASDRVQIRVSGQFENLEQIRAFPIRAGDQTFRLGDIATVYRGFQDPAAPKVRYQGQEALAIAVAMREGGDILVLGKALEQEFARLEQTLPIGMTLTKVSDQPAAVKTSVGEFVQVLIEALAIVLLVSFFSLGFRTGLVVAISIPIVLAMTFTVMHYLNIGLHKISLGSLVLALGLMVDDAIIAVEMMAIKMEQGYNRIKAASFAWTSTAFPMLTGTLITAAGFLPIATAASSVGEYTRSIFQVVGISLVVSWIAAVMFVPYLGYYLLPDNKHQQAAEAHDPYDTRFYRAVRALVNWCVGHRWLVIGVTLLVFSGAVALFKFVPKQFFPESTRLEMMVDLKLTEGASLSATEQQVQRLEKLLAERQDIDNYVAYVGTGAPRFYLPLDQQLPATSFAQFVIVSKSLAARAELRTWLIERLHQDFPEVRARVTLLENGPPVGYPVQFRVSGEHIEEVRAQARKVAEVVRSNSHVSNVHLDWEEPSKVVKLTIDQDRARALGVSTAGVSRFLQSALSGIAVAQYREGDELIQIQQRGVLSDRTDLAGLGNLAIPTENGTSISLSQVATLSYGFEEGVIWRRNRLPTVTVRGDIYGSAQAVDVVQQILPQLAAVREQLPAGYLLETGGTVEDSSRGQNSVVAGLPLFLVVVLSLLMIQLRSFSRSVLVFLTAPLGMIGVTTFLLLFAQPFGFVAMLGTIALSGMIMRNSVILVDQIEHDIAAGHGRWQAIVDATVRRFRPIVLTAMAAVLAMIPLSRSVFFGPMAVAIMGGLVFATALTLLFLPALYAAWFKVTADEDKPSPEATA
ncbi:efflux RND transporter permease subunit [Thiopseudomonas alkaliphila]|uniref:Multidrug transporter AcrB n=1 Tax=Thiopseudomonas alkaliphila TaxID=1697053 RepID=A0A0K1XF61_9GAMM|nr:efflux RND transporter permease subunit [Thiopseudomonas alkaliphila]AKX50777.1 multidrug transporter AcrB [Thiopseudomonas alkaliphila]AKX55048.1 multidrug transporter AcrB [Thiopseudomonas alkaliphila]AKX57112.1 multidrug transporter AcrB [Thiopseudomonas alkaliphila]AKX59976.1 multidrug transporter AcrB [Thiopseudomonas alkaliphila]